MEIMPPIPQPPLSVALVSLVNKPPPAVDRKARAIVQSLYPTEPQPAAAKPPLTVVV
jgi:hypothetical protein